MKSTLYYILDPMCSWCWGFRPVFQALLDQLPTDLEVRYIMGGLAADSDQPMPETTRDYVQEQWRQVMEKTGATFNWDFWTQCQPRRSTYPACRAVIAAGLQGQENIPVMIYAIQKAYYQQARNPADVATLISLAGEIGLDTDQFKQMLTSSQAETLLQADFELRKRLGANRFPSVLLETQAGLYSLVQGYDTLANTLQRFRESGIDL